MALHNILIVDDEYYICEGLHKKLVQLNIPASVKYSPAFPVRSDFRVQNL